MSVVNALFQVGGQANVGRGWVQGWVANEQPPENLKASGDSDKAEVDPETSGEAIPTATAGV